MKSIFNFKNMQSFFVTLNNFDVFIKNYLKILKSFKHTSQFLILVFILIIDFTACKNTVNTFFKNKSFYTDEPVSLPFRNWLFSDLNTSSQAITEDEHKLNPYLFLCKFYSANQNKYPFSQYIDKIFFNSKNIYYSRPLYLAIHQFRL